MIRVSRRAALLGTALGVTAGRLPSVRAAGSATRQERDRLTDLERRDREHLLVVVTKEQALRPQDYVPPDLVPWRDTAYELRAEVADQLQRLFQAATADGMDLRVISGYRSFETQKGTYQDWVRRYGQASADVTSARPGHSEHQTGLAVDLDSASGQCYLDACFGQTPEGRWVAENAHRFGFVLSYPQGSRERTGYVYEPWHIRYVGPRVAGAMHDMDVALLPDFLAPHHAAARLGVRLGRLP